MSASRVGITFTDEHRANLSKANSGPRSYRWKGGLSDPHGFGPLKRWAAAVKARDGYTCAECGITDSTHRMHAHHVKPLKDYPELGTELSNGITLCVRCHNQHHPHSRKRRLTSRAAT